MEGGEKLERALSEMERLNMNGVISDGDRMIQRHQLRVLGTAAIDDVDGPMREMHQFLMGKLSTKV